MPAIELGPLGEKAIRACGRGAVRNAGQARRSLEALVPALARLAFEEGLIRPALVYEVLPVAEASGGTIRFEDGAALAAPSVCARLGRFGQLAVGVATIGPALEAAVTGLFKSKAGLRAYLLNEIGNAALLQVSADLRGRLVGKFESAERTVSSPMFPGGDGFALDRQIGLVELARASRIGVRAGKGGGLDPAKSVSMVLGLGAGMPVWDQARECARCRAGDVCRHRRRATPDAAPQRAAP